MKSLLTQFCFLLLAVFMLVGTPQPVSAQDASEAPAANREATGGAQTLEDILRRQRGEQVAPVDRQVGPAPLPDGTPGSLAVRGGASDSDLWSAIRRGQSDVISTQMRDPNATTLVQDEGEAWMATRNGPLVKYSAWAIGLTIVLLAFFLSLRGRIKVKRGMSGIKIRRFNFLERFAHWVLAISFITLAVTGFSLLAGRDFLIPMIDWFNVRFTHEHGIVDPDYGKNLFASLIVWGKYAHNTVSWAFMLALILVFILWVFHNIPTWTDVKWLAKGGGIAGKAHPDARKFNAGQKIIFWMVILLGASVSASGIMLLFPYQVPMFGGTFETINVAAESVGRNPGLDTDLTLMQEQQYATIWHTIIATAMTVLILAHIYIGSIGMQGAFSAMGSGKVDLNWAEEHHNLWVEKLRRKGKLTDFDEGVVRTRPVHHDTTTPAE